jgi:DNA polymerase
VTLAYRATDAQTTIDRAAQSVGSLNELWQLVERLTQETDPHSTLPPVMGGGMTIQPRLACIFINPTHRNASTRDGWRGPRFPFIGTKGVWRVFANAGLLPGELYQEILARPTWNEEFAAEVYAAVRDRGLYLTNLVKWTGPNGDLPRAHLVKAYTGLLRRELELLRPRAVVTFGALPYRALTGEQVRLGSVLATLREHDILYSRQLGGLQCQVYPCYFPVGRGDPKAATEILRAIRHHLML